MELKQFLESVGVMDINAITVSKKLLADGKEEVTLNLANKKIMPERMESAPRAHIFHDVPGFVQYLDANKGNNSLVTADCDERKIQAVLSDSADRGREFIYLKPVLHPEFVLLSKLLACRMPISDFARMAMRNRRVLGETEDDGRDFAMLMQQITISSKVTARIGTGAKCVNGLMCSTEVKGSDPAKVDVDVPDSIRANLPLYIGRPEVSFDVDLTVYARQDRAEIAADAPELAVLHYEELKKILDEIGEALKAEVQVAPGELSYGRWDYNK